MKLDAEHVLAMREAPAAGLEPRWLPTLVALAAALTAIIGLYWETAYAMVATWGRSTAYNHGYLIVPIAMWLAWRKRAQIGALSPRPHYLGFAVLGAAGFAWLVAEAARVLVVQEYALVAMIAGAVLALAGQRVSLALSFPLAFLLFAVPSGEALVPPLMDWTADFTVAALRLTGIPVFREGNQFSIPTGNWSVVEACSGLRYVIASVTVGTLFAYLNYRRLWKRAVFIAASLVVPVVANFLRAYLIVMIGHLSDMRLGIGVDHMLFGWVFFGAVILALFWLASYWRDPDAPAHRTASASHGASTPALVAGAAVAAIALSALWPAYAAHLEHRAGRAPLQLAAAPHVAGWVHEPRALTDWRPHYVGAAANVFAVYRKGERAVALNIALYRDQKQDAELVGYQNAVVGPEDRAWASVGQRTRHTSVLEVRETRVRSARQRLLVWDWYRVAGQDTASPYLAKALLARDTLLGRGDESAAIVIAAPYTLRPDEAAPALEEFLRDMRAALALQ